MTAPNPWDRYAAIEPLFAVLANPKYLRANLTREAEEEFFATGDAYARHVIDTIHQRLSRTFSPHAILEFGCGPGRVAVAFAEHAPAVVACDGSPVMLALAKEHARLRGAEHILFQSNDELFASAQRFDLINASLVLQHMPPAEGLPLLARLLGKLGPNGIAVFTFPFRRTTGTLTTLSRWARKRLPGANAAANVLMRKPAGFPFLYSHVYGFADVLSTLRTSGCSEPYVQVERQGDLEVATIFVRREIEGSRGDADSGYVPPIPTSGFIDVRELIANTSMDELHRKAEEYFSSLSNWDHHMAKPFANAGDTPAILSSLAAIIDGMRLHPGIEVLEFGGGTGWLSRFLTQLGCRVYLTDVSPSALAIARELYRRLPPIGNKPEPSFLTFDGHRIDLPDASVDRIITFDAFHHVVNPNEVLAEMARVLRPGGIAAFAEPGPHHSKTPMSQFEMRTYGVVENDIDVHEIWETARTLGFADLKLAAYTPRASFISLAEYDDLLLAGDVFVNFAHFARAALGTVRNFFLYKEGQEKIDSRRADGLAARINVTVDGRTVHATVENTGTAEWLPGREPLGGVSLGCHLFDEQGALVNFELHGEALPERVLPSQSAELTFTLPPLPPGTYDLEFDLVAEQVLWFAQAGTTPARVRVVLPGPTGS
ncbi:MAG TPA: methyltransferase domain-containing protein [Thermoanaerobaculia bacterium]|jgi:SAM-dependent methyltransferase